jgi:hypothetical protein
MNNMITAYVLRLVRLGQYGTKSANMGLFLVFANYDRAAYILKFLASIHEGYYRNVLHSQLNIYFFFHINTLLINDRNDE